MLAQYPFEIGSSGLNSRHVRTDGTWDTSELQGYHHFRREDSSRPSCGGGTEVQGERERKEGKRKESRDEKKKDSKKERKKERKKEKKKERSKEGKKEKLIEGVEEQER